MHSVASTGCAPSSQAFTVLIPRPLRPTVEGLSPEVRQALLAELFRMASRSGEQWEPERTAGTCTLEVEVAGCGARVELDASRSRLTLVGVQRHGRA